MIERKGIKLGFDYSIHYYGPYSWDWTTQFIALKCKEYLKLILKEMTHQIVLTEDGGLIWEGEEETLRRRITIVRRCYWVKFAAKSAHDLEIITTTDYVGLTA